MENRERPSTYSILKESEIIEALNEPQKIGEEQEEFAQICFWVGSRMLVRASASGPDAQKKLKGLMTMSTNSSSSPAAMTDLTNEACVKNIDAGTEKIKEEKRRIRILTNLDVGYFIAFVVFFALMLFGGYDLIRRGHGVCGVSFSTVIGSILAAMIYAQRESWKRLSDAVKDVMKPNEDKR